MKTEFATLEHIRDAIKNDFENKAMTDKGWEPLFLASPEASIMIVGQAPGIKAQNSGLTWNDASGDRLREWLGVDRKTFYDPGIFAMVPMDFYYPGKGVSGDLPPRRGFAEKWHPLILEQLPNVKLIILVGSYAQDYYLKGRTQENLTETVRCFDKYLPLYFPLVHPSPRNIGWQMKHPWFMEKVIPVLREAVIKTMQ